MRYETIELIEQINKGDVTLKENQNETQALNLDLSTSNLLSSEQNTMETNEYLANIEITNQHELIDDHLNATTETSSNNIYFNKINVYRSGQNYACETGLLSPIKDFANQTYQGASSQPEAVNFLIPLSNNSISVEIKMTEHSDEHMEHCTNSIEFDLDNILNSNFAHLKHQFNQHDQHVEDNDTVQIGKTTNSALSNTQFSLSSLNENSNENSSLKVFMIDRLLDEDLKHLTSN